MLQKIMVAPDIMKKASEIRIVIWTLLAAVLLSFPHLFLYY